MTPSGRPWRGTLVPCLGNGQVHDLRIWGHRVLPSEEGQHHRGNGRTEREVVLLACFRCPGSRSPGRRRRAARRGSRPAESQANTPECTPNSAAHVKPEHAAGAARPWPSVATGPPERLVPPPGALRHCPLPRPVRGRRPYDATSSPQVSAEPPWHQSRHSAIRVRSRSVPNMRHELYGRISGKDKPRARQDREHGHGGTLLRLGQDRGHLLGKNRRRHSAPGAGSMNLGSSMTVVRMPTSTLELSRRS